MLGKDRPYWAIMIRRNMRKMKRRYEFMAKYLMKKGKGVLAWILCLLVLLQTGNIPHVMKAKAATTVDGWKYNVLEDGVSVEITGYEGSKADIEIPEYIAGKSVVSIGQDAFLFSETLNSIKIPSSVIRIGYGAFTGCDKLKSMQIPDSVTSIGEYAFYGCDALQCIWIPAGVTEIGKWAFDQCRSVETINVSSENVVYESKNSNAIIERNSGRLIQGCKTTIIPDGVTAIGDFAFCNCSEIESIKLPDSVSSIGESAFLGCNGLESIWIPSHVTEIKDRAFAGCRNVDIIRVSSENAVYESKNSNAIIEKESGRLLQGCNKTVIPNGVTDIADAAFESCGELKNVNLPDSLTRIGNSAFRNCSSLKNITIPEGVSSIGEYAFESCFGLGSIVIPEGVTSIGELAFHNCFQMNSIMISSSVTEIGKGAFGGCSGLESINVSTQNVVYTSQNSNAIIEKASKQLIQGCKTTIIPSDVSSIGDEAFQCCTGLRNISIPNSVLRIGKEAFWGCSDLNSIFVPNTVENIGKNAFDYCPGDLIIYTESDDSYAVSYAQNYNIKTMVKKASDSPTQTDTLIFDGAIDWSYGAEPDCRLQIGNTWGGWDFDENLIGKSFNRMVITFNASGVEDALKAADITEITGALHYSIDDADRWPDDADLTITKDGEYTIDHIFPADCSIGNYMAIRFNCLDKIVKQSEEEGGQTEGPLKFSNVRVTLYGSGNPIALPSPETTKTPSTDDPTYKKIWDEKGAHAYIFYQTNTWDYRDAYIPKTDGKEDSYHFIKAGGADVTNTAAVADVNLIKDGEYTVSISGINLSKASKFHMLGVSTDISKELYPDVNITEMKVSLDDKVVTSEDDNTPIMLEGDKTHNFLMINMWDSEGDTEGGSIHYPLGKLNADEELAMPQNSIEITFRITGLSKVLQDIKDGNYIDPETDEKIQNENVQPDIPIATSKPESTSLPGGSNLSPSPAAKPTAKPDAGATGRPDTKPTASPADRPDAKPSAAPTIEPDAEPTIEPSTGDDSQQGQDDLTDDSAEQDLKVEGLEIATDTVKRKGFLYQPRVQLTWDNNRRCDGYEIWKKKGNGSFAKVDYIDDPDETEWFDVKLEKGCKYSYKVLAYVEEDTGKISLGRDNNSVSIKIRKTIKSCTYTAKRTGKKLKVTFKKAEGTKYQIQVAYGKSGKWKSASGTLKKKIVKVVSPKKLKLRVRTGEKVNGKMKYGKWSKVKKVR